MIRAIAKGTVLFAFGRIPGGPKLYRYLTREKMGTQATHVDKLARVWPRYAGVWQDACGLDLTGKTIWMHEGGHTPFPFLISYLLTGRGAIVTNVEATLSEQYLQRSIEAALALDIPCGKPRIEELKRLCHGVKNTADLRERLGGKLFEHVDPTMIPLSDASVDLCHTGGTLEHYTVPELKAFIAETYRILRPGAVASHVFDHRDHLYHADKRYPFLFHLSLSNWDYNLLFGHKLLFHNRLLPMQVREIFESAGFEFITMRRVILPSGVAVATDAETEGALVGLDRKRLAPQFRSATDADLRTAAGHYLFRKPL